MTIKTEPGLLFLALETLRGILCKCENVILLATTLTPLLTTSDNFCRRMRSVNTVDLEQLHEAYLAEDQK